LLEFTSKEKLHKSLINEIAMSESVSYPTVPSYVVGIVVVSVALVMLTLVLCLLYYLAKKSFISKEHPISRFFFQRRNIRVSASEGQIEKLRESTAETTFHVNCNESNRDNEIEHHRPKRSPSVFRRGSFEMEIMDHVNAFCIDDFAEVDLKSPICEADRVTLPMDPDSTGETIDYQGSATEKFNYKISPSGHSQKVNDASIRPDMRKSDLELDHGHVVHVNEGWSSDKEVYHCEELDKTYPDVDKSVKEKSIIDKADVHGVKQLSISDWVVDNDSSQISTVITMEQTIVESSVKEIVLVEEVIQSEVVITSEDSIKVGSYDVWINGNSEGEIELLEEDHISSRVIATDKSDPITIDVTVTVPEEETGKKSCLVNDVAPYTSQFLAHPLGSPCCRSLGSIHATLSSLKRSTVSQFDRSQKGCPLSMSLVDISPNPSPVFKMDFGERDQMTPKMREKVALDLL